MLLMTTFTARFFKLMILNGDGTCHFAFAQYEKAKTQQELISHQLKLSHSSVKTYTILRLSVFVQLY